jgi:hypothetical protein
MARGSGRPTEARRNCTSRETVQLGRRDELMGLETVLIIILILAFLGGLPTWPHSREWGYYPSGLSGLLLIILILLLVTRS